MRSDAKQLEEHGEGFRYRALHTGILSFALESAQIESGFCFVGGLARSGFVVGLERSKDRYGAVRPLEMTFMEELLCGTEENGFRVVSLRFGGDGSLEWDEGEARRERYLIVALREGGCPRGILGLRLEVGDSESEVWERIRTLIGALSHWSASYVRHQELARWVEVAGSLAEFDGVCAVIDEERGALVWLGSRGGDAYLEGRVEAAESRLLELVRVHARKLDSTPPPCPAFEFGKIANVALDRSLATFGGGIYTVVAISALQERTDPELSKREQQVARLLVDGYTIANSAAILGLSENTVRTYVRRLYCKLGVCSRAELAAGIRAAGFLK